ncbi:hypothetical protein SH1V18_32720 [Vallitalea longa]|uniref:AB hydrolase-1 domain-containing protein n=1 Tax=Vallitalea longa TaxID=2936439 RepID=A0A9W5YC67_9FIRM|nr:alpha/beta hydrolase [Vallitalea longa]GKX30792.1 hypothetical protein SH1V18_32720 [Vallitalea longa]
MVKVFKNQKGREQVLKSYDNLLELWDTDIEEVNLQTRYGITHCIKSGNKANPPLLMFHGVGDNSAVMWILNIKELAKHFYCIAVDTIGGPGKSIPNENFVKNKFNQVEWINEIVQQLQINNFNIVGISNGAYMAYNYLTHEKEKVNKVICLEGGMVTGNPMISMLKTIFLLFPQILVPNRNNLISIMKKLTSPESNFFEQCPEVVEHMIMLMRKHNQKAMFIHKLEKYDKHKGRQVKDKLNFLIGEYRLEDKKAFTCILNEGGFNYETIGGAGHGINHEQPQKINSKIIQYLLN